MISPATSLRNDVRVLVIDHYDSYTYNLVHLIASVAGELPDVVQHDDDSAHDKWRDGYTHVVLSPGPGRVGDAADFAVGREVIRDSDIPVLGVCLGMQGIVAEFGGEVGVVEPAHGEVVSVSHCGEGVFASIPPEFSAVRYHSQAALLLPESLEETAMCSGPDGRVVMGVKHRSRPIHGVQFHPESILTQYGDVLVCNFLSLC